MRANRPKTRLFSAALGRGKTRVLAWKLLRETWQTRTALSAPRSVPTGKTWHDGSRETHGRTRFRAVGGGWSALQEWLTLHNVRYSDLISSSYSLFNVVLHKMLYCIRRSCQSVRQLSNAQWFGFPTPTRSCDKSRFFWHAHALPLVPMTYVHPPLCTCTTSSHPEGTPG